MDLFTCLFQYGNADGKEGYWSYNHIILQLEDVLDVLYIAYGDKFDYLFLFDKLCGHNCMHPDTLNINATSVGFGGRVGMEMMHDLPILDVDGCRSLLFISKGKRGESDR
eukprot:6842116-Ditylum_brightwellii.AAC.1